MSSILESLTQNLSGDVTAQIAEKLGTDSASTETAINAALPMMMGALGRNASGGGEGLSSLTGLLDADGDGSIMDDLMGAVSDDNTASSGLGMLGQMLGNSQGAVEQGVEKTSGLSSDMTSQLLGMLAPMVIGSLSKTRNEEGMDDDGLMGLLGGLQGEADSQLGGLSQFLDADGDGSVVGC
ncbi:MAG: DUF937 domain-containing protein [Chloroflexota bacterium]